MGTGANLPRYDNFLDEEGEFSGKRKRRQTAMGGNDDLEDELNKLNREAFSRH